MFFGRQKYYKNNYEADIRNEHTESVGQRGPNESSISLNEHYIFCVSKCADTNHIQQLRKRFGKNNKPADYVEIYDVEKFTDVIYQALLKSGYADYIIDIQWYEVEYSKNKPKKAGSPHPPPDLSVYQKPENAVIVDEIRCREKGKLVPKEKFECLTLQR